MKFKLVFKLFFLVGCFSLENINAMDNNEVYDPTRFFKKRMKLQEHYTDIANITALFEKEREKIKNPTSPPLLFSIAPDNKRLGQLQTIILMKYNWLRESKGKDTFPFRKTDLKDLGISTDTTKKIHEFTVIKKDKRSVYIVKSPRTRDEFLKEMELAIEVMPFVKGQCQKNKCLPHFVKYKVPEPQDLYTTRMMQLNPYILMTKAAGEDLCDHLHRFVFNTDHSDTLLLPHMQNIGRQIGNFHMRFLEEFDPKKKVFRSILHGDLHMGNIFYHIATEKVTFIDYATMANSIKKKKDCTNDLLRLFFWHPGEVRRNILQLAIKNYIEKELIGENNPDTLYEETKAISHLMQVHLARIDMILLHLKTGYLSAFEQRPQAHQWMERIITECIKDDMPVIEWDKIRPASDKLDPNIIGPDEDSSLHLAIEAKSIDMGRASLEKESDITAHDSNGQTSLDLIRDAKTNEIGDLLQVHCGQASSELEK